MPAFRIRQRIGFRLTVALLIVFAIPAASLIIAAQISRRSLDAVEQTTDRLVRQAGETLEQTVRSVSALVNFNTKAQILGIAEAIDLAVELRPELAENLEGFLDEPAVIGMIRNQVIGRAGFVCLIDPKTDRVLLHKDPEIRSIKKDLPSLARAIDSTHYVETLAREQSGRLKARGLAGWRRSFVQEEPLEQGGGTRYWVLTPLKRLPIALAGMTTKVGLAESIEADVGETVKASATHLKNIQARAADVRATYRISMILLLVIGGLVVSGSLYYVRRAFLRPIADLTGTALAVQRGDLHVRSHVESHDEFEILSQAVNDMLNRITTQLEKLSTFSDVLEHQVAQRTRELKRTQAQMLHSEKLAAVGTLTAGIMHEINNPVNFINGSNFTLNREVVAVLAVLEEHMSEEDWATEQGRDLRQRLDKIREAAKLISTGSERIQHIVTSLRSFARAQEKQTAVDLHEGIDSTLVLAQPLLKNRITIHKDYARLPLVDCNPGDLNQVFMNLVINASQAIPDQGEIWVRTYMPAADTVAISIADSGPGIPPDVLPRIFDPFFTTKEIGKGTGMGLSICAQIVRAHQGEIRAGSREGGGAVFTLELPLRASVARDESRLASQALPRLPPPGEA